MKRWLWLWLVLTGVAAPAQPLHEEEALQINGISQWISVNGVASSLPLLLYIHGGPGNSAMSYQEKVTGLLQKHFVVVHWDQRTAGKTAEMNPTVVETSVIQMREDAIALITFLLKRYQRERITLMGHSWGGFLALEVALARPELITACLAISPMVNQNESERLSLAWMKKGAAADALEELNTIHIPFRTVKDLYLHRKWLATMQGNKPVSEKFVQQWAIRNFSLFREASAVDLTMAAKEFHCPVYFFVGGKDHQTESRLTADWFELVKAEKKDLFWFPDSGHNLNLTESKKLQQQIITLLHQP